MEYHIHDLVGAELVERFVCTTPPYLHTFVSKSKNYFLITRKKSIGMSELWGTGYNL